jgi:hypothetical protein
VESYRERAILALTEITGTGFFGERQGGLMKRADAERFVDELIGAARAGDLQRLERLRATLASLAKAAPPNGGHPDSHRLAHAQRAADDALRLDDEAALGTAG